MMCAVHLMSTIITNHQAPSFLQCPHPQNAFEGQSILSVMNSYKCLYCWGFLCPITQFHRVIETQYPPVITALIDTSSPSIRSNQHSLNYTDNQSWPRSFMDGGERMALGCIYFTTH